MDFVVPDDPAGLEAPGGAAGRIRVHRVIDVEAVADIDALVSTLSDRLQGGGDIFAAVLEHDVFDALYSLLKCVPPLPPPPSSSSSSPWRPRRSARGRREPRLFPRRSSKAARNAYGRARRAPQRSPLVVRTSF